MISQGVTLLITTADHLPTLELLSKLQHPLIPPSQSRLHSAWTWEILIHLQHSTCPEALFHSRFEKDASHCCPCPWWSQFSMPQNFRAFVSVAHSAVAQDQVASTASSALLRTCSSPQKSKSSTYTQSSPHHRRWSGPFSKWPLTSTPSSLMRFQDNWGKVVSRQIPQSLGLVVNPYKAISTSHTSLSLARFNLRNTAGIVIATSFVSSLRFAFKKAILMSVPITRQLNIAAVFSAAGTWVPSVPPAYTSCSEDDA